MRMAVKCVLVVMVMAAFKVQADVDYPGDYRQWQHVKTMLIEPGHALEEPFQGIHHIYGNDKAIKGLKSGEYADGATLVFDLLKYKSEKKVTVEGDRKLLGVMVRDKSKYSDTGGWGYQAFAGDSRSKTLVSDGGRGCHSCHQVREPQSYVFSEYRK